MIVAVFTNGGKMFEKIASEEGNEAHLYKCTGDKWSIGYGFNLEDAGIPEPVAKYWLSSILTDWAGDISCDSLSLHNAIMNQGFIKFITEENGMQRIGYHFNLAKGIPGNVSKYWLDHNISHLQATLSGFDFYDGLDEARQTVLVDMAYQMGVSGLFGFKKMINAIKRKDWEFAAVALLDSKYAGEDSPNRAKRNAETLRTGKLLLNT